jgi:hypothetical protein
MLFLKKTTCMKTFYLLLIIPCFLTWNSKAQQTDCNDTERIKQEILDEINAISREISPLLSHRDREYLEQRLDEIYAGVNCLTPPVYNTHALYPMAEPDFKLVLTMIDNEKFESDKISVIQQTALNNYFTIGQLTRMIEKITFEDNRLKVVEVVYPAILDRENASLLYNFFTFTSNKEKLTQIILKNQN